MKYARDIYIQNTLAILLVFFFIMILQQTFLASDYLPIYIGFTIFIQI